MQLITHTHVHMTMQAMHAMHTDVYCVISAHTELEPLVYAFRKTNSLPNAIAIIGLPQSICMRKRGAANFIGLSLVPSSAAAFLHSLNRFGHVRSFYHVLCARTALHAVVTKVSATSLPKMTDTRHVVIIFTCQRFLRALVNNRTSIFFLRFDYSVNHGTHRQHIGTTDVLILRFAMMFFVLQSTEKVV